jgi:hypothetical protein
MRRPGLWVANGHPGDPSLMLSWRPGALTGFYDYLGVNGVFTYKEANPDLPIIVRFQHFYNWQDDPEAYARRLGNLVASKWHDLERIDPYVYFANEMNLFYENGDSNANNQPLYTTREFYQKYARWVRLTAEVIKNQVPEMKLVTPPFAFGHHEDGAPDSNGHPLEDWAGFDYLYETVRDYFDNILTFHSYWGHAGGSVKKWLYDPEVSSWYAFRWRRLLKLFETRYNLKARIIIDEAGNFGAAEPDFTDQILYHAKECLSDARVIALTYFLWLDPTNHPGNLPNSWAQTIPNLAEHLNRMETMPDVPIVTGTDETTPRPGIQKIRVLFDDGTVRTMPLEQYLRAVVPAEMPAGWPAEALKAQAVAARSYARYTIDHPRHQNADICTNPAHCQNFDLAKTHPKTDAAIQATANIVARYNNQAINALFSANCGGHTRDNEAVFTGGSPVPYLRGVDCPVEGQRHGHGVGLCQYGARAFADQGHSYDQIIRHYYTGVTLGRPATVTPPSPPAQTGTLSGLISDHTGQPVSGIKVVITGQGQSVSMTSKADGSYRFINVPPGIFQITLPDYQVRRENIAMQPPQDLTINLSLPAPVTEPTITVELTRGPGLPLIVGDWGRPNVAITVTAPSGAGQQVMTGTKPEFGPGGFETYATETGTYLLEIEDHRFEIPMNGQFTRLNFIKDEVVPKNGIIEGTLIDHQNRPVPDQMVRLTGEAVSSVDATDESGNFFFYNLPAGSYSLTVDDTNIKQTVISTGQNRLTLTLQLAAPPAPEWRAVVEREENLPLLVGNIGLANQAITITAPNGAQTTVISGSKPEWGPGGFELYARTPGTYTIQFLNQTFTLPINSQFTRVTFHRTGNSPS